MKRKPGASTPLVAGLLIAGAFWLSGGPGLPTTHAAVETYSIDASHSSVGASARAIPSA